MLGKYATLIMRTIKVKVVIRDDFINLFFPELFKGSFSNIGLCIICYRIAIIWLSFIRL